MKRHHYLTLSALYLAAHTALADDNRPQPPAANPSATQSPEVENETFDVMTAIRDEVVAADKLAARFEILAGSHLNAQNLVAGMRNASTIKLSGVGASSSSATPGAAAATDAQVSFQSPTQPMAYSDIHHALTLAQAQLAAKQIDRPTPAQLKAVLAGGELANAHGDAAKIVGILPLRKRSMSWDAIARALRVPAPGRIATAARLSAPL